MMIEFRCSLPPGIKFGTLRLMWDGSYSVYVYAADNCGAHGTGRNAQLNVALAVAVSECERRIEEIRPTPEISITAEDLGI